MRYGEIHDNHYGTPALTTTMERRRCHRFGPLLGGEDQAMIESGTQWVCTNIVNLSAAGALLTPANSEAQIPAGETRNLCFDNGGQPILLKATVIRADGRQIAFEFCDLSPDAKRAIDTKLIRMAIISGRVTAIDGNEVPPESQTSSLPELCEF